MSHLNFKCICRAFTQPSASVIREEKKTSQERWEKGEKRRMGKGERWEYVSAIGLREKKNRKQRVYVFSQRSEWVFLAPNRFWNSLRNKGDNKHSCLCDSPDFKRRLNSCFSYLPCLVLPCRQVMVPVPADEGILSWIYRVQVSRRVLAILKHNESPVSHFHLVTKYLKRESAVFQQDNLFCLYSLPHWVFFTYHFSLIRI